NLNIPNTFNFNTGGVPYSVDNSGSIVPGSFTRVAYYFEVQVAGGPRQWVWASMDTFNPIASLLGVPNSGTGIVQNGTLVSDMNVETNHGSITAGTGFTGIVEFWASNYSQNGGGAFGSSNSFFDWKDTGGTSGTGHGSMQIFNITTPGSEETLFGFNGLNQSGRMGIASQNAPGAGDTDWTFGPNASAFTIKNLEVWVGNNITVPEPATATLGLLALGGLMMRRRRAA
ncbi:MAG: PEP-CTERM sorting domain-containing protein, partial [Phycisphaeraceae bacterium]